MSLTTATIKAKLAAAPWSEKDNAAQKLIGSATTMDLKSLDVEGVLRLYEALCMLPPRVFSSNDKAALKRLATYSQFQSIKTPDFGVGLVKKARASNSIVQTELTPDLVTRIYAAENKRLSWYERIGVDGDTIGRGQLGQLAYTDVNTGFKNELEYCIATVYLVKELNDDFARPDPSLVFDFTTYKPRVPGSYSMVWRQEEFEDFVVAAYLALRMISSTKPGRSSKDTARFAVAMYHGMRTMVVAAQASVKDEVNWAPVEAQLKSHGKTDEVDYVNEVVK